MSSYSVASGLRKMSHDPTLLSINTPDNNYDVIIQFYSARNLPRTDMIGYSDPYFIATIDGQICYTSNIMSNTSTPQWNDEIWIIRNIPRHAKLTVKVYDKDDEKLADDYIGRFIISDLINYNPPSKGEKIIGALGQYNGRFHLSIEAIQSTEETRQFPRYTFDGPCRYFRHNSFAIGRLTMLNTDCIYYTWKIQMKRISIFFPPYERQHWNRQYQPARNVFSRYPLALAPQSAFKFAHKILYRRTLKHNENGRVNTGDDLWKYIFADNITKQIKPCLYTYVIDDTTWRFSETGQQIFTDFASKHVLLANCSKYVRYAGEFHPRPKYGWNRFDDEWELVFDNESGTYSPSADLLNNLKALLMFNFPGLNIVTYDYKDPELKQSIEQLKIAIEKYKHSTPTLDQLVTHFKSETSIESENNDDESI